MARLEESVVMVTWQEMKEGLTHNSNGKNLSLTEFAEVYFEQFCSAKNRCVSYPFRSGYTFQAQAAL